MAVTVGGNVWGDLLDRYYEARGPKYGLAVGDGDRTWRVIPRHESLAMTAIPPLADVVPHGSLNMSWPWPKPPEVSL